MHFHRMMYYSGQCNASSTAKKWKFYSSNCRLCNEISDFCLTKFLAERCMVSLWRIFTQTYSQLDSKTSSWFSWISSNFTWWGGLYFRLAQFWEYLEIRPGVNFSGPSNSDLRFLFPTVWLVVSVVWWFCHGHWRPLNENFHSHLPANFCPWQPKLYVIFLFLISYSPKNQLIFPNSLGA